MKGDYRLELPVAAGIIQFPHTRPLAPIMPQGVSPTTTDEKIEQYFANYLMDPNLSTNEEYRYATWINGKVRNVYSNKYESQLEWSIRHLKEKGYGNNHPFITVGDPDTNFGYDKPYKNETERRTSPCLRGIDIKVKENKVCLGIIYRSWDLYCISDDSEVLTNNGWKNINTINQNKDTVCSLNLDKWQLEYCDISNIVKYPVVNETMYHLKTERVDQLVTANHRVLHKYVTHSGRKRIIQEYQYTQAEKIQPKDGSFIPLAAPYFGGSWSIGSDKASLLGWVLTDASYKQDCNAIEIYQTKKKYHKEIRDILNKLNINFSERFVETTKYKIANKEYPNGINVESYVFYIPVEYSKWIFNLIPKREPIEKLLDLVYEDRKALFDTMIMADGSIRSDTNKIFYSIKKDRLQWFQKLSYSLGYHSIINEGDGAIYLSKRKESMIQRQHFDNNGLKKQNYSGFVWCVNNKNTNFVMRRNNLISITGNCGFPENMGGFTLLNEYIANELGVEPGPLTFYSQGLHCYGFQIDIVKEYLRKE